MAEYKRSSPWANTPQNNLYLELLEIRPVPAEPDDFLYEIEGQYKQDQTYWPMIFTEILNYGGFLLKEIWM